MATKTNDAPRAGSRRRQAGIRLLAGGALLALLAQWLGHPAPGRVPAAMLPVGLAMAAAGLLLLCWSWWRPRGASSRRRVTRRRTVPAASAAAGAAPPRRVVDTPAPAEPLVWGPPVFQVIEWQRFDAVVETLFSQGGFDLRRRRSDDGVDLWLHSRRQPDAPAEVLRCRHWPGRRVGIDKLHDLHGLMAVHGVQRGHFATVSTFTGEAAAFARAHGIELLDVAGLLALIERRTPEQRQALLAVALEGDYWRPTCTSCGAKMTQRPAREGRKAFWGCSTYPRCSATLAVRERVTPGSA